jgi:hypothetical protein
MNEPEDIARNFRFYPALTVMVFLRRDLGYRLVNPQWLIVVTVVEIIISIIIPPTNNHVNALFIFAIIALITGMGQRLKRWREFNRGLKQHSFYIGTSYFDFPWMPLFLRKNRRIPRKIDPLVCVIVGVILLPYFTGLGLWLLIAGLCLYGFERDVHRMERNQTLDMVDSIITSEVQSDTVQTFEENTGPTQERPAPAVPSGLGNDIHDTLKKRDTKPRAPQKAKPPEKGE